MTPAAERLAAVLNARFEGARVTVEDDSAAHAGHAGAAPGGGTHFTVEVVAPVFRGLGRLDRHRLVYDALAGEMAAGVHALKIRALAPEEAL